MLAQRAVEQARQQQGVVVAAGGDGTINAVAQVVLKSGCPFGVLP
jgi:diacylglycerol kinase family enzyme